MLSCPKHPRTQEAQVLWRWRVFLFLSYGVTHHNQTPATSELYFSLGVGSSETLHVLLSVRHEKTRWRIGTWCSASIFGRKSIMSVIQSGVDSSRCPRCDWPPAAGHRRGAEGASRSRPVQNGHGGRGDDWWVNWLVKIKRGTTATAPRVVSVLAGKIHEKTAESERGLEKKEY